MLAYRHAFHAGNHADVLKHLVLCQVLRYMAGKDKPYTLVDTHAGAGGYSLESRYARRKGEHEDGIGRVLARGDRPPIVDDYAALVQAFNAGGPVTQYPGSPAIAQQLLRPGDRLRLHELHPTDYRILESFLGSRPRTQIDMSDGYAALKSELPPTSRRAVVLVDPSYEIKTDYPRVLAAVREALTRFAEAVVLVWYPQLLTIESAQLPGRLQAAADALAPKGWLHVRLTVQAPDAQGFGLVGSGMVVINPPYVLHDALQAALPWLVDVLGQVDDAAYLLEQRAV